MSGKDERERLAEELVKEITDMGYPSSFGRLIAVQLGTESTMLRMLHYLSSVQPNSAEEIADEMLAICSDRDRWRKKKETEYYNAEYNKLIRDGLDTDD